MKLGPKMAFMQRAYLATEAENREDLEHDRELWRRGLMNQTKFHARASARSIGEKIRWHDDSGRHNTRT